MAKAEGKFGKIISKLRRLFKRGASSTQSSQSAAQSSRKVQPESEVFSATQRNRDEEPNAEVFNARKTEYNKITELEPPLMALDDEVRGKVIDL